jgi:flagellar biosynthetic protein FliP
MLKHVREQDLAVFVDMAKMPRPQSVDDIPTYILIPAFITSELKTAFQIGFFLFLPFLVIDMAVASVLMSMGMMMVPPVMVSLPLKILLFVLVDGWRIVVKSTVLGFG